MSAETTRDKCSRSEPSPFIWNPFGIKTRYIYIYIHNYIYNCFGYNVEVSSNWSTPNHPTKMDDHDLLKQSSVTWGSPMTLRDHNESVGMMTFPTYGQKIKMFQTTNQTIFLGKL
jgi:hypothetical protein